MKEKGFENIQLEKDLTLLVVNTGIRHSTGTLVSLVRRFKENNLSIFEDLVSTAAHICSMLSQHLELVMRPNWVP